MKTKNKNYVAVIRRSDPISPDKTVETRAAIKLEPNNTLKQIIDKSVEAAGFGEVLGIEILPLTSITNNKDNAD